MAEVINRLPDGTPYIIRPDGHRLQFDKSWKDDQINSYMADKEKMGAVDKLLTPSGQDKGGKMPPPPAAPTEQYRGVLREPGIAATQYGRGLLSPAAIPGDINTVVNSLTAGIPKSSTAWNRIMNQFPTTQSLDQLVPGSLTPEGFWERELAGASRGAGEATSMLAGMRAPGLALPGYPYRYGGSLPMNLATGTASGAASTAAEQAQESVMKNPNPLQKFSIAPLVPMAAGGVAGLVTGAGIPGLQYAGRFGSGLAGVSKLPQILMTPYEKAINNLGGTIERIPGSTGYQPTAPSLATAGQALRDQVESDVKGTPKTLSNIGVNGMYGTNLSKADYNSLVGTPKKPIAGVDAANVILNNDRIATQMRQDYPDFMDQVGASHVANMSNPDEWNTLPGKVKESLVPNTVDRNVFEQTFAGGVVPTPRASFQGRAALQNLKEGLNITNLVKASVGYELGSIASYFASSDPGLQKSIELLGIAAPFAYRHIMNLIGSPAGRQGIIGTTVGMGPGTNLAPENLQYSAPGQPNQPPGTTYTPPADYQPVPPTPAPF